MCCFLAALIRMIWAGAGPTGSHPIPLQLQVSGNEAKLPTALLRGGAWQVGMAKPQQSDLIMSASLRHVFRKWQLASLPLQVGSKWDHLMIKRADDEMLTYTEYKASIMITKGSEDYDYFTVIGKAPPGVCRGSPRPGIPDRMHEHTKVPATSDPRGPDQTY